MAVQPPPPIDRANPMPLAYQLAALFRARIERGELRPGDRLPTEMELCQHFRLSRTPVRRALGQLTRDGLLVRFPGRGTFVSDQAGSARTIEPATITVTLPDDRWCWPLQHAAAAWNREFPDQPVRLTFQVVGMPQLRTRLRHAVARGEVSDIALIDSAWVAEFADHGYIQSLHAIEPATAGALAADLIEPLRSENSYRGELYGLPSEADLTLLWYRQDWFASEGLQPSATWDEWLAAARHFLRPATRRRYRLGPYPLAFCGGIEGGETTTYQLLPLLWSGGADVIDDHMVVLNSPETQRVVQFVHDLVRVHQVAAPGVVEAPWNGPALAFAAGDVAMAVGGSYESGAIRAAAGWDEHTFRKRVGFVPIPAVAGGQPSTLVGGISYAVFCQSRQPRLALHLLARALAPETLHAFCAATGQNPPTISATRALDPSQDPFLASTSRLLDHARIRWPIVEYARVSQQIARMFETVILDDLTPAEAVARAAAVISGITGIPERDGVRSSWLAGRPRARRW